MLVDVKGLHCGRDRDGGWDVRAGHAVTDRRLPNPSPTDPGLLTAWPRGIVRTDTSNLNFQAGQTIPDMVIVPVGSFDSAGKISIYNGSPGPVHVVVDVAGDILFGGAGPA